MSAGARQVRAHSHADGLSLTFDVVRFLAVTVRRPQLGTALRNYFEAASELPLAFQQQVARIEATLKTEEAI